MKKLATWTWLTIPLVIAGCSWKASTDLVMQIKMPATASRPDFPRHTVSRTRTSANNPTTVEGMHCYFISVAGSGISPGISDDQLGSRKTTCFGFGAISEAAGLYDLTRTGKTFRVSSGSARTVRVYGVYSATLGRLCEGMRLADIFSTATRPRIYQLGETVSDLYRDSKIVVNNNYDAGSADDLAELCTSSTGAGGAGDPGGSAPIKGARLISFNTVTAGQESLFNYQIGEDGKISTLQAIELDLSPQGIAVSSDGANLLVIGPTPISTPGNVVHYPIDVTGINAGRWTRTDLRASLGDGQNGRNLRIATPPYFYFAEPVDIRLNRFFSNSIPAPLSPPNIGDVTLAAITTGPDHLFTINQDSGLRASAFPIEAATGNLLAGVPLQGPVTGSLTIEPVFVAAKSWFFMIADENIYSYTFVPAPTMALTLNNSINLGAGRFIRRIRYDATNRRLMVLAQVASGAAFFALNLDESGNLPTTPPAEYVASPDTTIRDFAQSPDGKFLYLPDGAAKLLKVFSYDGTNYASIQSVSSLTPPVHVETLPLF